MTVPKKKHTYISSFRAEFRTSEMKRSRSTENACEDSKPVLRMKILEQKGMSGARVGRNYYYLQSYMCKIYCLWTLSILILVSELLFHLDDSIFSFEKENLFFDKIIFGLLRLA